MKKLVVIAALAIGAVAMFNKVSGKPDAAATAADLPEVTFAASIPLYPGARYLDRSGGSYSSRGGEWGRYVAWTLELPDGPEKAVAFYDRKLPEAERDGSGTDVTYTMTTDDSGQRIDVRVIDGQLEIWEYH